MSLARLIRLFALLSLAFNSSAALASDSILNILVENTSMTPYALVIYGSDSSYEIIDGFDTLAAQQSATVQINYPANDQKDSKLKPIYHILLLNLDDDCCRIEYSAHPASSSPYRLLRARQFTVKLKSFSGSCKVWQDSPSKLHIILIKPSEKHSKSVAP